MISIHNLLKPLHLLRRKKIQEPEIIVEHYPSPTWDESYPERKALVTGALDYYTMNGQAKALQKLADQAHLIKRMNEDTNSTGPR